MMKKILLLCTMVICATIAFAQEKNCTALFNEGKRIHDSAAVNDIKTYAAAQKIFKDGLDLGCDKAEFQYWYNICQTKIEFLTATLEFTPKSLEFEAAGGKKGITINTSYKVWDFETLPPQVNDWLTGNQDSQTLLSVTCGENKSLKGRESYVTIKAGNKTEKIIVTQKGKQNLLPDVVKLLCANLESNPTVTTKSNAKYKGERATSGQRTGLGGQLSPDGNLFFGKFANGEPVNGIFIDAEVTLSVKRMTNKFQVGNFEDFQLNGEAKTYDEDGVLSYQGIFYNDAPKGDTYWQENRFPSLKFEILEENTGFYIGETKEGLKHGKGIFVLKTGDLWYGDWSNGNKLQGIEINMDGTVK